MRRTCSVHVPLLAVNRYAKGALTHSRCSSAACWVPEAGVVPASAARSIPSLVSPEMPQQQSRAGQFPVFLLQQRLAPDGVDSHRGQQIALPPGRRNARQPHPAPGVPRLREDEPPQ
jgi:hypothetical protein